MALDLKVVNLEKEFNKLNTTFTKLKTKALTNATRQALNRTLANMQTKTNKEVRKHRRLKASEIKKDFFKMTKARGSVIQDMKAQLQVSGKEISLIRFVVGKRTPRKQKGVKVYKRKELKVKVTNKSVSLPSAFIAKGANGKNHVFKRTKGSKSLPIAKQVTPGLASIVEKQETKALLTRFMQRRLADNFSAAFLNQLSKLKT